MTKPKIAILTTWLDKGGAEKQVRLLLDALQHEFEIHLILTRNDGSQKAPEGVVTHYLGTKEETSWYNFALIPFQSKRLKNYLKKHDIPFVLSFLFRANLISSYLRVLSWHGKIVLSERSAPVTFYGLQAWKGKIVLRFAKWLFPKANLIITNSEGTRHELEHILGIKTNYAVIRNALDIENIYEKSQEPVADVDFSRFTFICVGNLHVYKNQRLLIEALAQIPYDDCQLLLVGDGTEDSALKALAQEQGVSDRVIFAGYNANAYRLVARSDCFVSATLVEGFPNAHLEALCLGLPVISTDCVAGPRELLAPDTDHLKKLTEGIEIAEYGILVALDDAKGMAEAMKRIMDDTALYEHFQQVAPERVAVFTPETTTNRFIDTILENLKK